MNSRYGLTSTKSPQHDKFNRLATRANWFTTALFLAFVVIVVRRAWLNDDAFITFRTVDNFVNGYGLTWNITERVQSYTNPLWLFLLSFFYLLTGEIQHTSMLVSVVISCAVIVILCTKIANSWLSASFGILVLALSKAFVDYSTSGMENPLTHLLLAVFFAVYLKARFSPRSLFFLSLLAALAAVNRLDTLLFYIPVLIYVLFKLRSRRGFYALLLGQAPLLLWFGFATFYYGFPFPNTAYAKLNTHIPVNELVIQGIYYLFNSLQRDPLTLLMITVGLSLPFWTKQKLLISAAIGGILYLLYVVRIGGDFMGGRFLSATLFVAVALVTRYNLNKLRPVSLLLLFGSVIIAGLNASQPTFNIKEEPWDRTLGGKIVDHRLIFDEYMLTSRFNSLIKESRQPRMPAKPAGQVAIGEAIGRFGFYADPDLHIVDVWALSDPLLARLPPIYNPNWHIGHFTRVVPRGYIETLETGQNRIADKNLSLYYNKLKLVTRGALWDSQRLLEIWKFNTGQYNHLVDFNTYRYPDQIPIPESVDETGLTQELRLVNPTHSPYVFAFIWHHGHLLARYLIDDSSEQGQVYQVKWIITPEQIWLRGDYKRLMHFSMTDLSADYPLAMAVSFSDTPFYDTENIFEQRFWFKMTEDHQIGKFWKVEGWQGWHNNPDQPEEVWRIENVDCVIKPIERIPAWDRAELEQVEPFTQQLYFVNPTFAPYVYTYVSNGEQTQKYLLDDASRPGKRYNVAWIIQPSHVWLQGAYKKQLSTLDTLSANQPLNISVSFQDKPESKTATIFERRYRFTLTGDDKFGIILPPETWRTFQHSPGMWLKTDISSIIREQTESGPLASIDIVRNDVFTQSLHIVNPTHSPYVYAYLWNNEQTETYLLDDSSRQGDKYDIEWAITSADIFFQGSYRRKLDSIQKLSDKTFLAVAVAFADSPTRQTQNIFERRFTFRMTDHQLEILLPSESWRYPHWPEQSGWQMEDIAEAMTDQWN